MALRPAQGVRGVAKPNSAFGGAGGATLRPIFGGDFLGAEGLRLPFPLARRATHPSLRPGSCSLPDHAAVNRSCSNTHTCTHAHTICRNVHSELPQCISSVRTSVGGGRGWGRVPTAGWSLGGGAMLYQNGYIVAVGYFLFL